MASRSEIARQDQASEQRRLEACANIVAHVQQPIGEGGADTARGVAVGVLSALAEAIDAEAVDVRELRRKGWQSAAKTLDETAIVVRGWRDLLIEYTPPTPKALPQPADIAVSARAADPTELDARLKAAFDIPAPVRHIRTAIEPTNLHEENSGTAYGNLCGTATGSFTHPGGSNCIDCHLAYAKLNDGQPYGGPGHVDVAALLAGRPPSSTNDGQGEIRNSDGISELEKIPDGDRRVDEPITPTVARSIREEIEAENALPVSQAIRPVEHSFTENNAVAMPTDAPDENDPLNPQPREAKEMIVGMAQLPMPTVIEPTARRPARGRLTAAQAMREAGSFIEPTYKMSEEGATLVEPTPFTEAVDKLKELPQPPAVGVNPFSPEVLGGVLNVSGVFDAPAVGVGMPTIIEPAARRPARARLTAAQVREHGLARQRGLHHRSVSQVQGFADCGTRAALSDLEVPAWWNVGGKAFHACAEEINRQVASEQADGFTGDGQGDAGVQMARWLKHFDAQIVEQCAATPEHHPDTWRAANRGSEHYDWWRVEGPIMVQKYVVWLSGMIAEGWRIATAPAAPGAVDISIPVIEFTTRLDVGLQVPNLSIIDLALMKPATPMLGFDDVLIVDLKAGNSAPKDTFQLGVYGWCALAAGVAQHPAQVRGAYYRARKGEMMAPLPVLDLHPWPDVVQRYRDQDVMERQGIYMPNVTSFCGGCGVRDLCPAQASS